MVIDLHIIIIVMITLIGCVGWTHIITNGAIMAWFRDMMIWLSKKPYIPDMVEDVVTCEQCCGFWVGSLAGIALLIAVPDMFAMNAFMATWWCLMWGGGISLLSNMVP